jgi:tetratricopeptide (TPR) repeat protein
LPSTPVSSAPKGDDFFLQADEKLRKFDYKGALEGFNQALRINPNYEAAYTGRGVAREYLGDKKGAIDDLSQAIRLNPNNVRSYPARGTIRFRLGDKQGAEIDLKKVLSLDIDAKDYRAYGNRGILRSELGDKQGAIADYNQAIRINPNDGRAYNNCGNVRYKLGTSRMRSQTGKKQPLFTKLKTTKSITNMYLKNYKSLVFDKPSIYSGRTV